MDHKIKINRALNLSSVGAYHRSAQAMLDTIPTAVIAALPARALAELLDSTWTACQQAKSLAEAEAVDAGYIWSARHGRSLDIQNYAA